MHVATILRPWRPATVPSIGAMLIRKAATKVVRPRSDQGSRCTDKELSEKTEDQALIRFHFSFESLALQNYNHKASDDGTMLGYRRMMVGNAVLAHKASAVR